MSEVTSMAVNRQNSRSSVREVEPKYLRPSEWMKATGMSVGATYRALYANRIRGIRVGKSWFIPVSELEDFFDREAA
jgi:hypothetical protein